MRKMKAQLQFFLRSASQVMGLRVMQLKSHFWKCSLLNRTVMASFTYIFTISFIHPRNITGNIYHSLYHIIRWKNFWVWGIALAQKVKRRFVFICLITAQEDQSLRWDFISFLSTKMPDALDDKCEGDSQEQFSIQAWSHTGDSLAKVCQPNNERESGNQEEKSLVSISRSLFLVIRYCKRGVYKYT